MTFHEIFEELNKNCTNLITEDMFNRNIPNWYVQVYEPMAWGIDRHYLELLYPNSESIEEWDKNGVFANLTLPTILERNRYRFDNLYRTTTQVYNPIENYDRNEITEIDGLTNSNNNTNTESTSIRSGNEEILKTGEITNLKNGNETNLKNGTLNTTKSGSEEISKSGSQTESTIDSGSESHTTNGEVKETNQQRAFNSGLIDTSTKTTSNPISGTDILTFDSRKNEKETLFNNMKDTTTYNDVSETTTYDNISDTISYNDIADKTSYNNLKETMTYNDINDTYNSNTETNDNSTSKTTTNSRVHGNIGVTTTAQMLEGERTLSEFDFIDILMKTILFELSVGYVVEEGEYN